MVLLDSKPSAAAHAQLFCPRVLLLVTSVAHVLVLRACVRQRDDRRRTRTNKRSLSTLCVPVMGQLWSYTSPQNPVFRNSGLTIP
eukprot:10172173-Alexandrium_andersonii.AAC.1